MSKKLEMTFLADEQKAKCLVSYGLVTLDNEKWLKSRCGRSKKLPQRSAALLDLLKGVQVCSGFFGGELFVVCKVSFHNFCHQKQFTMFRVAVKNNAHN